MAALPFLFAGIVTAIIATLFARIFGYVEKQSLILYSSLGPWLFLAVPILFFLSWFIVDRFAPFSNGSGIPQLMAATDISHENPQSSYIGKLLGIRIIIVKVYSRESNLVF